MYASLRLFLPPMAADLLMAVCYAVLIVVTVYCCFEPQATFTYLNL